MRSRKPDIQAGLSRIVAADEPDVRVRPARREDIPGIVLASNTSVTDEEVAGFGGPSSSNPFVDAARLAAAWTDPNHVRSEEVIVAEAHGNVVGYVTVEDRGEVLEIVNIDVAREHQQRGIGTRLVRFVEERARRERRQAVTLGTSRNAEGVPWKSLLWWQSRGYGITHEEENAWTRSIGPGAREIRMRKDIQGGNEVALREVRPADLPVLFEYQQDPVANRMAAFTAKDPADRTAFEEHWTRILADPAVTMRVILLEEEVIGTVGSFLDPEFGKREVTYWIGRAYWGRGLATKALSRFLEQEATRPLYARAARDNAPSLRVLEKCGFARVSAARGWANARGEVIDEVILGLAAKPAVDSGKP